MKRFLVLSCVVISMFCSSAFATEIDLTKDGQMQNYISGIGFKILNSNKIEKRMVFYYKQDSKSVNASASFINRAIYLNRGITNYLENEDEYAAVLSHEISHGVDSYDGVLRGYYSPLLYALSPKKFEKNADKRAVDFMVKAGYNPLALIVVMSKIFPQERFDWCCTHPLSSRRMMYVYEYIYNKYPEYLANNVYKNNIYYQNFLLTSRENRLKFQKKLENPNKLLNTAKYL